MVNLVGSSDSFGIIPLSSFQRVMPDGTTAPFVIPGNRVLLITKIMFYIASARRPFPVPSFAWNRFIIKMLIYLMSSAVKMLILSLVFQ